MATPTEPVKKVEPAKAEPEKKEAESLLKPPEQKEKTKDGTDEGAKAKADQPIEVKIPEGVSVNAALVDEFKAIAKDVGLDSAKAQKVLDVGLKMQEALVADMDKSLQEFKTASVNTLKQEWGTDFDKNVSAAQQALNAFGSSAVLEELNGLENSPALMRMLAKVGRAMGGDTISVAGAQPAGAPKDAKSTGRPRTGNALHDYLGETLYPSMQPKG